MTHDEIHDGPLVIEHDVEHDVDAPRVVLVDPIATRTERRSDARAANVLQAIALLGVVVSVIATVVAWRFLSDLDRNLEQSLTIGEEAAATLVDTIDVADQVVGDLDQGLQTLDTTLGTLADTSENTGGVASTAAQIAGRLPDRFDEVDTALGTVESLSSTIDTALRALSRIPLGPDYDPAQPLPEAVGELRDAFGPIGDDLDRLSTELDGFAGRSDDLAANIDEVAADVQATRDSLSRSTELLARYRTTATEAETLARTGRGDFAGSLQWMRFTVLLVGAFALLAQYLPWWLGRRIRPLPIVVEPDGVDGINVRRRGLEPAATGDPTSGRRDGEHSAQGARRTPGEDER